MRASVSTAGRATIRRDWLAKSTAGVLLGFTLALTCSGLLAHALAGIAPSARAQLVMWSIAPVWLVVMSACFFFRSGVRAWLWLGGANLLAVGALLLLRLT